MEIKNKSRLKFPLIDAFLLTPKKGKRGIIGICTNYTAAGEVYNNIEEKFRRDISVMGSLIVNRDGVERMLVNSLVHPTMNYLILFSEEAKTFSPSTNLLLALKYGIDSKKRIIRGKAASPHYPNISADILDLFRKNIIVLPIFMSKNNYSKKIINDYLSWFKPKISKEIYDFLVSVNKKEKIYYDSLNKLIELVLKLPKVKKDSIVFNSKDFQRLQPPKIHLEKIIKKPRVPFRVFREGNNIRLDIKIKNKTFFLKGNDVFLMEYSLMKHLGRDKNNLSPLNQLLLGAELARLDTEIKNDIKLGQFVIPSGIKGKKEILLEPRLNLVPDKKYYYHVKVKDKMISVACLSFDVCESVFELQSKGIYGILEYISKKNRFEKYEMDFLHRMDVASQAAYASLALNSGFSFIQDFPYFFRVNKTKLSLSIIEGDSFLSVHKGILRKIYTVGLTEEHGDKHKGLARTNVTLAVYRNPEKAFQTMPLIYKQGDLNTVQMRNLYQKQLLRFDNDGSYNYGERTRNHFGFDQLKKTIQLIKKGKKNAAIVQRFDPVQDMGSWIEKETKQIKFTHDPCLTHDIFFINNNKLNSFHIARVQNAVNAYPENIFGLYDAYLKKIARDTGLKIGDMYMLSSRANILLLTEEQRFRNIISEPSKPTGKVDSSGGPYELGKGLKKPEKSGGVAYFSGILRKNTKKPKSKIIRRLADFEGVNIIEKAIDYLKKKGGTHNNPVLTEYQAGKMDAQGDYLVFFQANVFGGKINANAVFVNHSINELEQDKKIVNYLSTQYSIGLKCPLGGYNIFYVAYSGN